MNVITVRMCREINGNGVRQELDLRELSSMVDPCFVFLYKFTEKIGEYLSPTDINPESFTGESIDIIGYRWLSFAFKGRCARGKLYVAKSGPSVLGWHDQGNVHILDPNSVEKVLVVDETASIEKEMGNTFPNVFKKELGTLERFEHKIILKQDAVPKIHKMSMIPIMLRDEVEKELKKLKEMDVIESVESSDWISPVVVARRTNRKISLCVDLRHVNNNILIDRFPLRKLQKWYCVL